MNAVGTSFKVWDSQKGEFADPRYIAITGAGIIIVKPLLTDVVLDKWEAVQDNSHLTICRQTGRFAKGKPIHQFDIIREELDKETNYYVVTWITEWARFALLTKIESEMYSEEGITALDETMQETFGLFEEQEQFYSIAGNMFQSPHKLID